VKLAAMATTSGRAARRVSFGVVTLREYLRLPGGGAGIPEDDGTCAWPLGLSDQLALREVDGTLTGSVSIWAAASPAAESAAGAAGAGGAAGAAARANTAAPCGMAAVTEVPSGQSGEDQAGSGGGASAAGVAAGGAAATGASSAAAGAPPTLARPLRVGELFAGSVEQ
jgi:hypothetical protein